MTVVSPEVISMTIKVRLGESCLGIKTDVMLTKCCINITYTGH